MDADTIIVRFDPERGPPERRRYVQRRDDTWRRVDEVWTGCRWRARGAEIVESVTVATPD